MRHKHRWQLYHFTSTILFICVIFSFEYISGYLMPIAITLLCIVVIVYVALRGGLFICPHCGMETTPNSTTPFRKLIGDNCPHCGKEI